jgi:hypothetical protein
MNSEMMVMTGRENDDVTNVDVIVSWMLKRWWSREREKTDVT